MTSGNTASEQLAIAEQFAAVLSSLSVGDLPEKAKEVAVNDLLDMAGLCIATREKDYIAALIGGCEAEGQCTAFGHARTFDASSAAMINGAATHGEDFDDTLEGAPIRVGAMVIPAVLAACERFGRSGADALLGITAGLEAIERTETLCLVVTDRMP